MDFRLAAITLDERIASALTTVRLQSCALVVARSADARSADIGLQAGDLVHEVNGRSVYSVDDLRTQLATFRHGDPIAMQVERSGQWMYVAFELP